MGGWEEREHPRDNDGKFAVKPVTVPEGRVRETRVLAAGMSGMLRIEPDPVEVDRELADLYTRRADLQERLVRYEETRRRRPGTVSEEQITRTEHELARVDERIGSLNEEFRRVGGWSRFYLVVSSDGHVHSSMNCPTCHLSTRYVWLTELSGMSETDLVEEFGEKACTVCFPSAPTHPAWGTGGRRGRAELAEREARQARVEQQRSVRDAKRISGPDGEPLTDAYGHPVDTDAAATAALRSSLGELLVSGADDPKRADHEQAITRIAAAVAAKRVRTGTDPESTPEKVEAEFRSKAVTAVRKQLTERAKQGWYVYGPAVADTVERTWEEQCRRFAESVGEDPDRFVSGLRAKYGRQPGSR